MHGVIILDFDERACEFSVNSWTIVIIVEVFLLVAIVSNLICDYTR